MERSPQDRSEFAGCSDLVHPLGDGTGETREVTGQQRIGRDVSIVLLSRGHDQWREVRLCVRERTDCISDARGSVQVDERGAAARHRITLRDADSRRLLQREHVAQIVRARERVDQRELSASGISE